MPTVGKGVVVRLWRAFLDLIAPISHSGSRVHGATEPAAEPATSPGLIRAAGGVVWRRQEVAIIHRSRYGDWTLPKGKVRKGESLRNAALREVEEETGCEASIRDLAGVTRYEVKGVPKVVVFWNMELAREGPFRPDEEVDQLGAGGEELSELVDYEQQRRQCAVGTRRQARVVDHAADAGIAQQLLSATQFHD